MLKKNPVAMLQYDGDSNQRVEQDPNSDVIQVKAEPSDDFTGNGQSEMIDLSCSSRKELETSKVERREIVLVPLSKDDLMDQPTSHSMIRPYANNLQAHG